MKVRFTRQADADIIESYLYGFQTFGQAQAERYEQGLRHVIGLIADHPRMAAERHDYRPPVRLHHHARHYIVYLIEDDHILVIRILRDDVDLTRHLANDATSP
jgi:toxin ParE1/3/4